MTAHFEQEFAAWVAEMEREAEATRRSEVLTAADYAVTINATTENCNRAALPADEKQV